MANTENLQDLILNEVRREHTAVTMFLMNGFQLKGIVTGFDNFVVVLSSDGVAVRHKGAAELFRGCLDVGHANQYG